MRCHPSAPQEGSHPLSESPAEIGRAAPQRIPPGRVSPSEAQLQAQLDQLERQFELLRSQVRKSQRLASLGTGAAVLAHEFNNLLTPILNYAQAAMGSDDPAFMAKALGSIHKQAKIMVGIAGRVLRVAADEPVERKPTPVRELVDDTVLALGRDLSRDNITLTIQIDPQLFVLADRHELLQVLFNLLLNARQAMLGKPGRLAIDAAPDPADPARVHICVRDSGPGIKPDDLPQVFEPFFSTKQHESRAGRGGIGLGLSVSREIIAESGGELSVESEYGRGTTFMITLPAAEPPPAANPS